MKPRKVRTLNHFNIVCAVNPAVKSLTEILVLSGEVSRFDIVPQALESQNLD